MKFCLSTDFSIGFYNTAHWGWSTRHTVTSSELEVASPQARPPYIQPHAVNTKNACLIQHISNGHQKKTVTLGDQKFSYSRLHALGLQL